MKVIAKRSVIVSQRKTSVSLEDQFWTALRAIASARALTLSELVSDIDRNRAEGANLSSALRCFVLAQYRSMAVIAALPTQVADAGLAQAVAPAA